MISRDDYLQVEDSVVFKSGNDKGLQAEALLTCEEDFRAIFSSLEDAHTWVELGSGYGIGPLLFASLNPLGMAYGIEFEETRYCMGQKLKNDSGLSNVHFFNADLLTCDIPVGDIYFFYFPTGIVLDRVLMELNKLKHHFKIVAIESHGDFLLRLNKENWLKAVTEIPLVSSRHSPSAVVYEKCGLKIESIHDFSFLEKYLLIAENEEHCWLGESYGLEWLQEDQYQLLIPPRTITSSQVRKVLELSQIGEQYHPALQLRKLGIVRISCIGGMREGFIRKIYISPTFKLELSSGEQVEWREIKKIFWENILCFDSSLDYFYSPHVV